jgi:hypothetical protein
MNNRLLHNIIGPKVLDSLPDEWGVIIHCVNPRKIGFATTLMPPHSAGDNSNPKMW